MRWSDYYEKINDWSVSTAVSKISSLEDMGDPDEIVDALNIIAFEDEKGGLSMSEKAIVHKVPEKVKRQSIEILKVRKETMEYLRQNGFKTIGDIVKRQDEIPSEFRGNIYAYIMFGMQVVVVNNVDEMIERV